MGRLIDLTGQKFYNLTVIDRSSRKGDGAYWNCLCDCGKKAEVKGAYLRSGHTKSCGCLREIVAKNIGKNNIKDLTGQRFGNLVVIKDSLKRIDNGVVWTCICDCGKEHEVLSTNLISKSIQSCGCQKRSQGERKIEEILKAENIQFISEFCVGELNNARFDFAIIEANKIIRIIEFDGEHHYKEVCFNRKKPYSLNEIQIRDQHKNQWAMDNNIPLVRIPYWELDNINIEMIMGDQYLVCYII